MLHFTVQFLTLWGLILSPGLAMATTFLGPISPQADMTCDGHREGWMKRMHRMGLMGNVCRAQNYGDALRMNVLYDDFIVDEKKIDNSNEEAKARTQEYLKGYLTNVLNLIDQIAEDYYREHRQMETGSKDVSAEELEVWKTLVKLAGYHETNFSHYQREGDSEDPAEQLKVIMGDPVFVREGGKLRVKKINGRPVYRSQGMYQKYSQSRRLGNASESLDLVLSVKGGAQKLYGHFGEALGFLPTRRSIARCEKELRGPERLVNAALSAYAMYNGGGICRFADSEVKYADYKKNNPGCDIDKYYPGPDGEKKKNACINAYMKGRTFAPPWVADTRLKRELKKKNWTSVVSDGEREKMKVNGRYTFSFDLNCAKEGKKYCLGGENLSNISVLKDNLKNRLFTITPPGKSGPGTYCVYKPSADTVYCTRKEAYVPCLRNLQNFPLRSVMKSPEVRESFYRLDYLPVDDVEFYTVFVDNPAVLCRGGRDGVFVAGDLIKVERDMNLFKEKSFGEKMGSVKAGQVLQVLDHEIIVETGFDRWYRVAVESESGMEEGFLYGGDDVDWTRFVSMPTSQEALTARIIIPRVGDIVEFKDHLTVYTTGSAEVRNESEFKNFGMLPKGTMMRVTDVKILGEDQAVYLRINAMKQDIVADNIYIGIGQLRTNARGGKISASLREFVNVKGRAP